MYTGTLILDLLSTVERAEHSAWEKQLADESELRVLFASQIPIFLDEAGLVGAA
jgi:hypothetical protein